MIELKTRLRRWGNSFGIVVPINKISNGGMKEGEEITIFLRKAKTDLKEVFGALKKWKIDS